jgi:hypothetical protein
VQNEGQGTALARLDTIADAGDSNPRAIDR